MLAAGITLFNSRFGGAQFSWFVPFVLNDEFLNMQSCTYKCLSKLQELIQGRLLASKTWVSGMDIFPTGVLFFNTAIKRTTTTKLAQWNCHQGLNKPSSLGNKAHSLLREECPLSASHKPVPCLHQRKIGVSCSAQKAFPTSQTCCWASVLRPGMFSQGWCHKVDTFHL